MEAISATTNHTMNRLQEEYARLTDNPFAPFSLHELLSNKQLQLSNFCCEYIPNPHAAMVHAATEQFGKRYGVWLQHAHNYVTCATWYNPLASADRLINICNLYALSFYFNDTMGREKFALLTPSQQQAAAQLRERIATLQEDLQLPSYAHSSEKANAEILTTIKAASPATWFAGFLHLWNRQVAITHRDLNITSPGSVPAVSDYMEERAHGSGMYYAVKLIEYGNDQFLNWLQLTAAGLDMQVQRLHWLVIMATGLMNDLFSFEKEFIDCRTTNNFIIMIALNEPNLTLSGAIIKATAMVRDMIIEFQTLIRETKEHTPGQMDTLKIYLHSLECMTQGTWLWHLHTERYKRQRSIWKETRL